MILGLTGYLGTGKNTLIEILKELGYRSITMSDLIREECQRRGMPLDREHYTQLANRLRLEEGAGVWARRCVEKMKQEGGENWVIDGIRNPGEVKEFRALPGFKLVAVTVPEDEIVRRIMARKRDVDTLDPADIRKRLRIEQGEGQPPEGQQIKQCIEMADYEFENTLPLDQVKGAFLGFYRKIERMADTAG